MPSTQITGVWVVQNAAWFTRAAIHLLPPTLLSPFNQTSGTVSQFDGVLKSPSPQISDSWVLKYMQCAVNHSSQLEAPELLSSASQPPTLETTARCFSAALPGGDT